MKRLMCSTNDSSRTVMLEQFSNCVSIELSWNPGHHNLYEDNLQLLCKLCNKSKK